MADATYQPKVYRKQGGDELVVASGGQINVESGGKITAAGTQAAHIANASAVSDPPTKAEVDAIVTKLNAVLVVLEGAGLTATS
jgi:hypothetical protein